MATIEQSVKSELSNYLANKRRLQLLNRVSALKEELRVSKKRITETNTLNHPVIINSLDNIFINLLTIESFCNGSEISI
jgi:predicted transcriptional regulator